MKSPSRSSIRRRRGLVLLAGLMCLLIATMMAGGITRAVVASYRTVHSTAHVLQAEWLVEAGLERATVAARTDNDYEGETWDIPAGDGLASAGRVVLSVERSGEVVEVTARAEYPADVARRATAERTIRISPPEEDSP